MVPGANAAFCNAGEKPSVFPYDDPGFSNRRYEVNVSLMKQDKVKKSVVNLQSMTVLICDQNMFTRSLAAKPDSKTHAGSTLTYLYVK
jgi:hypothetical protein